MLVEVRKLLAGWLSLAVAYLLVLVAVLGPAPDGGQLADDSPDLFTGLDTEGVLPFTW